MSDIVKKLETLLKDQPANPLRPHQMESYAEEAERLEKIVKAPSYIAADRGGADRRYRQVQKMLAEQAPKKVSGDLASQVYAVSQEVLANDIRPAMLTREEMRRNPAGSVGTFMRQENSKPTKRAISAWKRAQFALDPSSTDPDHANVERFRPEKPLTGAATFMAGAQISGHFAMSPQAKANWPAEMPADGTVSTPLKQAKKREFTAEQRAALGQSLAAARKRKAEAKAASEVGSA